MSSKKALITGATGLVGKVLLKQMLEENYYEKIYVLSRKELAIKDERLEVVIVDSFDHLKDYTDYMNVPDIYCVLGTTRKKAGSKKAFIKVDYEYPLELAKLATEQPDFEQYLVVTSTGANSESPLFYNMVKGRLEDALIKLDMKSLKIFRPSLLLGNRDEFRPLEEVAKIVSGILSFFIIGSRKTHWAIKGEDVAKAMLKVAKEKTKGLKKYKPGKILTLIHS